MIPVYVSNGAIITRRNGRNWRLIPQIAKQLNADGVEFLMYESWDGEEKDIVSLLKNSDLKFPVVHIDKRTGDLLAEFGLKGIDEVKRIVRRDTQTALELGATKLVMHLWNGPFSDIRFDEGLKAMSEVLEITQKAKLVLAVENVASKYSICLDHLEKLINQYSELKLTYDTKMAALHDENALVKTPRWSYLFNSVTHLHVNDTRKADSKDGRLPIMHIGDGEIDFDSFFAFVKASDFNGSATVESTSVLDDGNVDTNKLNQSIIRVRKELNVNLP